MPTDCLFRDDSYLKDCEARVVGVTDKGIALDRTVFYATSGGQPGDTGALVTKAGGEIPIGNAVYLDAAKSMQALGQVWNDGVLEQTAKAGAAVLERHGITMGQVMGQFGPYIMLVAAVAPPVMMTKKILSPPKEPKAVTPTGNAGDGQQQ